MDPTRNSLAAENCQNVLCKQPINCPWISAQPYQSTVGKNSLCEPPLNKSTPHIPITIDPRSADKTCPSIQQSSSQFFYFLRLMQLFPETHPATLHTVLSLCKNDFFCAVDKLLYAKRCKALYSRSQAMFKRCSTNRSHPYCGYNEPCKNYSQKDKNKENVVQNQPMDRSVVSESVTRTTVTTCSKDPNQQEVNEIKTAVLNLKNEEKTLISSDVEIIVTDDKIDDVKLNAGDIITIDLPLEKGSEL